MHPTLANARAGDRPKSLCGRIVVSWREIVAAGCSGARCARALLLRRRRHLHWHSCVGLGRYGRTRGSNGRFSLTQRLAHHWSLPRPARWRTQAGLHRLRRPDRCRPLRFADAEPPRFDQGPPARRHSVRLRGRKIPIAGPRARQFRQRVDCAPDDDSSSRHQRRAHHRGAQSTMSSACRQRIEGR
jgi:hypothetical protein